MSVYKRGSKGVFYMNFTVNGERVFRSTGTYTKKEAKQIEAEEKRKLLKSARSKGSKEAPLLLSQAIEQTYDQRWKFNKSSTASYKQAERLLAFIGNIPIAYISAQTVHLLTKQLETSKVGITTINRYLASLKTILKHHHLPVHFIRLRKENNNRNRIITKEEEQQIVTLLTGRTDGYFLDVADLVEVLADTGCRLSEIIKNFSFKENINFKTNLITLYKTKNSKPRSVPMTQRVRQILQDRQENEVPFSLGINQVEYAWSWVRQEMGLENDGEFVIHALRHTCASRLLNGGVDLYTVKEWLGHSSIKVTERYAHLAPGKLVQAVGVLE